jgi:hypothetical protein
VLWTEEFDGHRPVEQEVTAQVGDGELALTERLVQAITTADHVGAEAEDGRIDVWLGAALHRGDPPGQGPSAADKAGSVPRLSANESGNVPQTMARRHLRSRNSAWQVPPGSTACG